MPQETPRTTAAPADRPRNHWMWRNRLNDPFRSLRLREQGVGRGARCAPFITILCFAVLATFVGGGCTSQSTPRQDRPLPAVQAQYAAALTAGRYVSILKAIEASNLDEATSDIDWWIDLAIIELQEIEKSHPRGRWGDVLAGGTKDLPMSHIYKRIAQFRRDHPRRHSVPLNAGEIEMIDAFVRKYQ